MSDDPRPAATERSPAERAEFAAARIASLGRKAALVLLWERIWPPLALVVAILCVFLTVSWLGLWLHVPLWARVAGVALTLVALAGAFVLVVRAPFPTWRERLARLDADSEVAHRPATALDDELASPGSDPGTRALWELHRARLLEQAARLRVGAPHPGLPVRDPRALRFGLALCAVAAWFVAGPEREARLAAAFDWTGRAAEEAGFRMDAWIDPPAYTQFPPVIIDLKTRQADAAPVRVPVRATLVVRASDARGIELAPTGGIAPQEEPKPDAAKPEGAKAAAPGKQAASSPPPPAGKAAPARTAAGKPAAAGLESRFVLNGDGSLVVRREGSVVATIAVTTIPDKPPTIQPTIEPVADAKGTLTLGYEVADDYGVVAAEAKLGKPVRNGRTYDPKRPPLVPAPQVALALPGGDNRSGEGRTVVDLSSHPWAGARVEMSFLAHDDAGQTGESASFLVTLPQRPFSKPLARALVEQRRDLILDPGGRSRILAALQALTIAPERFTPDTAVYLGLRSAGQRLRTARTDQDLIGVADFLWEMALKIEDGDMTDAEKSLRAAQDALKDALDKNAPQDEIARLTQELRQALDQFLREFAERQLKDQQNQQSQLDPNTQVLTPQDLKSMLDRMEDMARNGNREDAQRMLDQLRNLLDNLRTARNGQQRMDQGRREMEKQLDGLDKMAREQQQLRDKTFREGQKRREQARRGDQGQQQGQRGQKGQRGQRGQPGQQGDQPGDEQEMGQGGDQDGDQEGMEGLGQQQQALRQQLEEMKRKMRELGMNGEQGLEDAEEAMRQAEGAMGKGEDGQAVDAQGRALEGLRKGAQGLAQQMQQGDGQQQQAGDNPGGQPGQPGRRATASQPNDDPLGRPTPTTEAGDRAKLRRGGRAGTLEERAREVTEELRRRLGDPARPQDERDYLERLLPAN